MLIGAELAGTVRGPVGLKRAAVLVDRQRAIVWQAISDRRALLQSNGQLVERRGQNPLLEVVRVKDVSLVSRKNQITIPAEVMREAGLAPGDDVRIRTLAPGRIELIRSDELVDEFAGRLDSETYPPGYLDDVRAGWV